MAALMELTNCSVKATTNSIRKNIPDNGLYLDLKMKVEEVPIEQASESPFSSASTTTSKAAEYSKHTNLDAKPLSFWQQIHLVRLYYFTVPKLIHYDTILFCVGWFVFNIYNVAKDYFNYT